MNSKDYQIQSVEDWPNLYSLDQNKKIKEEAIQKTIRDTKASFFSKNPGFEFGALYHYLDPSRDIYYPPKTNEPSYCRAGLHYSIPDQVVGIGLKINPEFENENEWAMLYHGTKSPSLMKIITDGLKPGGGQAHQGTLDPWGKTVPNGVYFSFWVNQSYLYTIPTNPIILECFVKDVFVAPGYKGYTVSNISHLSRILIPITKDRTNQNI